VSAVVALIRDVRVLATKQKDPKLCVDLVLPDRGGTTDKLVMYDVAVPQHRRRYNASMRRLRALCRAAGVDLKELLPLEISNADDLAALVEALRDKSVGVDVSGRQVRYVGAAKATPKPTKCDEAPPKLIYYESGAHEGEIIPCVANAIAILRTEPEWRGVLAFDAFEGCVVALQKPPWFAVHAPAEEKWKAGPLTDTDTTRARAWFALKHRMILSATEAHDAVTAAAEAHVVHPVRDYLNAVEPTWDKGVRVETWLIRYCGAADTPYVRALSKIALIGAVARVRSPGCKHDMMIVFQGPQGIGKSSAIAALVPNENWFTDEFDASSKDGKIALRGVWLIEAGELAGLRKAEVETIRAFLSRRIDKYRDPYGRRDGRHPRQCALFGTVNPDQFLRDDHGNRRFGPVTVGAIDLPALRRDRDQLWSEACVLYERGESWHLTDTAIIAAAQEQQESRRIVDPREDIVAKWLAGTWTDKTTRVATGVTVAEVLTRALEIPKERATKAAQMDAAVLLDKCGWVKCPNRHSRGTVRVWSYNLAGTACPACVERWEAKNQEREIEKEDRQVVQVGHDGGITEKNGVQPRSEQVVQVGQSMKGLNGAGKPAHAAPLDSPASTAEVATSPPRLARERSRKKKTARGHASSNGAGARSR
jgi:predicted P-loop ATPase